MRTIDNFKATRNIYKRKDKIDHMSTIYTCRVHHIKYRAEEICYVRGEIRNVNEIILRTKYHFEMERKLERREKVYL